MNNALNKTINFLKMEKEHKRRWLDFKKEYKIKILDLMKDHEGEKFDLCISNLQDIEKNGYSNELITKHLNKAIYLHEKQLKECEEIYKQKYEKAQQIKEKNDKERESFKAE